VAAVLALDFFTRSKPACGFALLSQPDFRIAGAGGKVLSPGEYNAGFGGPNAASAPPAMSALIHSFFTNAENPPSAIYLFGT